MLLANSSNPILPELSQQIESLKQLAITLDEEGINPSLENLGQSASTSLEKVFSFTGHKRQLDDIEKANLQLLIANVPKILLNSIPDESNIKENEILEILEEIDSKKFSEASRILCKSSLNKNQKGNFVNFDPIIEKISINLIEKSFSLESTIVDDRATDLKIDWIIQTVVGGQRNHFIHQPGYELANEFYQISKINNQQIMIKNLVDLKENIELDIVEIFITDCAPFQVKKHVIGFKG